MHVNSCLAAESKRIWLGMQHERQHRDKHLLHPSSSGLKYPAFLGRNIWNTHNNNVLNCPNAFWILFKSANRNEVSASTVAVIWKQVSGKLPAAVCMHTVCGWLWLLNFMNSEILRKLLTACQSQTLYLIRKMEIITNIVCTLHGWKSKHARSRKVTRTHSTYLLTYNEKLWLWIQKHFFEFSILLTWRGAVFSRCYPMMHLVRKAQLLWKTTPWLMTLIVPREFPAMTLKLLYPTSVLTLSFPFHCELVLWYLSQSWG